MVRTDFFRQTGAGRYPLDTRRLASLAGHRLTQGVLSRHKKQRGDPAAVSARRGFQKRRKNTGSHANDRDKRRRRISGRKAILVQSIARRRRRIKPRETVK